MGFMTLFKSKPTGSKNIAKKRLNAVLTSDRLDISPELMNQLKIRLVEAVGEYVVLGNDKIRIELQKEDNGVAICTTVPIKQLKRRR